jgi:hypothetical protein
MSMQSAEENNIAELLATEAAMDAENRVDAEQGYYEDAEMSDVIERIGPCPLALEELVQCIPDDALDNSNNNSRTFKWTPIETVQQNTIRDGYTYVFISQAEGPMLSAKAKQQVMVLNYLLETPPTKKRVVNTSTLIATFNSDNRLETLVEKVVLDSLTMDIMVGGREAVGTMRVDAIPLHQVRILYMYMCPH